MQLLGKRCEDFIAACPLWLNSLVARSMVTCLVLRAQVTLPIRGRVFTLARGRQACLRVTNCDLCGLLGGCGFAAANCMSEYVARGEGVGD